MIFLNCVEIYFDILSVGILPCNFSKRESEAASDQILILLTACTSWLPARTCSTVSIGSWITHTKWHCWQKSKANFTSYREIHIVILR